MAQQRESLDPHEGLNAHGTSVPPLVETPALLCDIGLIHEVARTRNKRHLRMPRHEQLHAAIFVANWPGEAVIDLHWRNRKRC